jgi:hypothetical protein
VKEKTWLWPHCTICVYQSFWIGRVCHFYFLSKQKESHPVYSYMVDSITAVAFDREFTITVILAIPELASPAAYGLFCFFGFIG